MRKISNVALFISLIFSTASVSSAQNKLESWYTYWGVGWANVSYPNEFNDSHDLFKGLPGVRHISVSVDLFGFYWPSGEKTVLGVIVNSWGDFYTLGSDHVQINGYLLSFSLMHFLNHRIGQGFFVRGDFGTSQLDIRSSTYFGGTSDRGFGGLIGGGYGFPISKGTRILLNMNYSFRFIEGDNYGCLAITVGGLF